MLDWHKTKALFAAAAVTLSPSVAFAKTPDPAKHHANQSTQSTTIVVMGDSRTDGCVGELKTSDCRKSDSGFDEKVLNGLLSHAMKHAPAALFFTGDLTLGLEKEESPPTVDPGDLPASGGWATDFEYDSKTFARMIGAFKRAVQMHIRTVPFYPVVGNHDAVGPDAVDVFRKTFGLEKMPDVFSDPQHVAYAVEVGNAAFIVLATDYYQPCPPPAAGQPADKSKSCNLQLHLISQPQLAWLDQELGKHEGKELFVVAHEPAFSAGGAAVGLDVHPIARDAFWSILQKHQVTAYLCSHQHRFDVSQHGGVWQIISGGAGAPLDGARVADPKAGNLPDKGAGNIPDNNAGNIPGNISEKKVEAAADVATARECTGGARIKDSAIDTSYFHYVVLTVSPNVKRPVIAEIRDCKDNVRARLPLSFAASASSSTTIGLTPPPAAPAKPATDASPKTPPAPEHP